MGTQGSEPPVGALPWVNLTEPVQCAACAKPLRRAAWPLSDATGYVCGKCAAVIGHLESPEPAPAKRKRTPAGYIEPVPGQLDIFGAGA